MYRSGGRERPCCPSSLLSPTPVVVNEASFPFSVCVGVFPERAAFTCNPVFFLLPRDVSFMVPWPHEACPGLSPRFCRVWVVCVGVCVVFVLGLCLCVFVVWCCVCASRTAMSHEISVRVSRLVH